MIDPVAAWDVWRRAYQHVTGRVLPIYQELGAYDVRAWKIFIAETARMAESNRPNREAQIIEGYRESLKLQITERDKLIAAVEDLESKLKEARKQIADLKEKKYIRRPVRFNEVGKYERLDFIRIPLTPEDVLQSHDAEFSSLFADSRELRDAVRVILEQNDEQVSVRWYNPSKRGVS